MKQNLPVLLSVGKRIVFSTFLSVIFIFSSVVQGDEKELAKDSKEILKLELEAAQKVYKESKLELKSFVSNDDSKEALKELSSLAKEQSSNLKQKAKEFKVLADLLGDREQIGDVGKLKDFAKKIVDDYEGEDPETLFMKAYLCERHLSDGAGAESSYKEVLRGYVGDEADLSTVDSLMKAIKNTGGLEKANALQRRSYAKLVKRMRILEAKPSLAEAKRRYGQESIIEISLLEANGNYDAMEEVKQNPSQTPIQPLDNKRIEK